MDINETDDERSPTRSKFGKNSAVLINKINVSDPTIRQMKAYRRRLERIMGTSRVSVPVPEPVSFKPC